MYYVGVDLAWTDKNETGLCVLNESGELVFWDAQVFSVDDIVDIVGQHASVPMTIAVDAPLVIKNERGGRQCDSLLMKDKINGRHLSLFATGRAYMKKVYGCIRGEELVQAFLKARMPVDACGGHRCSVAMTETFPTGITLGLLPEGYPYKYKVGGKTRLSEGKKEMVRLSGDLQAVLRQWGFDDLAEAVETLVPWQDLKGKAYKHYEDMMDALLCSLALLLADKGYVERRVYRCDDNGEIMLPVCFLGEKKDDK